ncbi:MAG: hypothetical protein PHR77_02560 [Kiritimatiellae bacterium]|nr:hypothetical protein [Kiritimatiellia bacterium]MDD5523365.1 hypothetical protein [Kiritimatiellia bacterium]
MPELKNVFCRGAFVVVLMIAGFAGCVTQTKVVAVREPAAASTTITQEKFILPKVMFLIDEKSLGTIATAEVEAMATSILRQKGGQVVDQDMVRANLKKDQQMLKSVGDNRGAAALGVQYGADVIIVGEAVAKPSARRIAESNLRTYEAVVTLRAIRTDNSETIASGSDVASIVALEDVSGSSKALKSAAAKALDSLLPVMIKEWRNVAKATDKGNSSAVSMTVGGVDQAWKLKAIREKLRGIPDLKNVVQKSYTMGVALFDLESSLPAEELAEKLVLEPPQGLKFQILDVSRAKIELRTVAAPAQ